ncbi:DUF4238 domain-containing protein [Cochlodiniinecator piscidefendens]|uniref:DUF4238 domain-containing protein n=1 Tax=Cochlodiniinecator piscidefendens TaxID=2715756 RepID=UPI00140B1624|nr:DUF4238 domain-containing protein [Cochlodiniinecator piscidefendens]
MSDKDEPKDHHYIPAFYLKKWTRTEADGKLIEFRKVYGGKVVFKECSEKATGFERYLYSKETAVPAILDHSLESGFMKNLDDKGSKILGQMLSGSLTMTLGERNLWSKFIAILMLRSPEEMKASDESFWEHCELAAKEHEEWYKGVRDFKDPATFLDLMKELPPHEIKGIQHSSLMKFSDGKKFVPFLSNLVWAIRKLPHPKLPLLTSDRPVFCNNRLSFPDGLLFMPLSPDTVLYAQPAGAVSHPILGSASDNETMRFCNKKIVGQANQYVWANHPAHRLFIERHLGMEPAISFNEVALKHMRSRRLQ